MTTLFTIGVAWLAYVAIGYPLLVWLGGRLRPFRVAIAGDAYPSVSVLVSARNEEKDIAWKVQETLAWDYPPDKLEVLVASDASDDGTDAILAGIHNARFKYLRLERRGGKQVALNCLAEIASGDLLFFTDANTHIEAGALRRMVRYFADTRVGCVTGVEQTLSVGQESAMDTGGRRYFGYESWVNAAESSLGSVLVCDGSMFAIRRSLFEPLQPDIANDLELPLRIGGRGFAILFDPLLRSQEHSTASLRQEFARRRRICAQGLLGMWRLRHQLHGMRAWQFFSRKFLRWLMLVPLALLAISTAALASGNPYFAALLGAECVFFILASAGLLAAARGLNSGPLLSLPAYFLAINVAAIAGLLDAIRGRRFGVWEQPSLSRGFIPVEARKTPAGDPVTADAATRGGAGSR